MAAEKERIAAAALEFLPSSGAVLFDSGTTTAALAAHLPAAGSSLLALTNSLPIALTLMTHPQLTVHILGGQVRSTTMATIDSWALTQLRDVRTDVAFVGTNAFSLQFDREAVFTYADQDAIDVLVTNDGMTPSDAQSIAAAAGIEVVRV